jgi:hypothetical protein
MYPLRLIRTSLLAFLVIFALGEGAAGRTIIDGFTKAPTFTPPDGCIPDEHVYGVVAGCTKQLAAGRKFHVIIDTFVGSGGTPQEFLDDQIIEITQWWRDNAGGEQTFSSKASDIIPGNAPPGIVCAEYSVTAKSDKEVETERGITCAWPVEHPKPGSWKIEICVLEAYDAYKPPLGQKPLPSFDRIARALFLSMRL